MTRLSDHRPIPSARDKPLAALMLAGSLIALAASIFGLYAWPLKFLFGLSSLFCLVCVIYSALRMAALLYSYQEPQLPNIPQDQLPVFSILLPLYREANIVDKLAVNIRRIDYPADKLDIIFICEPHDLETIDAVKKISNTPGQIFITDGTSPHTKPHALNQALRIAKGEIITVYDAEDRPHPAQIHQAAQALSADTNLGVVQAPLTYYNSQQNWLTRQFTLEYAALFLVWLPFLYSLDLPFPLGGTSNHIRRKALEDIDTVGWDSWNVTEDADISFRMAAAGWKLGLSLIHI